MIENAQCKYFSGMCEDGTWLQPWPEHIDLIYCQIWCCSHPSNVNKYEGNCYAETCPLKDVLK